MTREEIWTAYGEALELAGKHYEDTRREAWEWCLKKLEELRQAETGN